MTTTLNLISLLSQTIHLLDNHTIYSAYHGNYGRAKIWGGNLMRVFDQVIEVAKQMQSDT